MYFDSRLFAMTAGVRGRIFLATFIGLIAVAAGVTRLALSGIIIAHVFTGTPLSDLVLPLLGVAGLIILRGISQYIRDVISHHTASLVKIKLREQLYGHIL